MGKRRHVLNPEMDFLERGKHAKLGTWEGGRTGGRGGGLLSRILEVWAIGPSSAACWERNDVGSAVQVGHVRLYWWAPRVAPLCFRQPRIQWLRREMFLTHGLQVRGRSSPTAEHGIQKDAHLSAHLLTGPTLKDLGLPQRDLIGLLARRTVTWTSVYTLLTKVSHMTKPTKGSGLAGK